MNTRFNPRSTMITVQSEYSGAFQTTSTVAQVYKGFTFSLSNLSNSSSYTALFDQYRILECECWISPTCSMATPGAPEGGTWLSAIDLDNASTPASYAAVQGASGVMQTSVLCGHYHRWVPCVATNVYAGAFGAYGSVAQPWLDCASTGVEQYGVKAAFSATTTAIAFTIMVRATIQFRGVSP